MHNIVIGISKEKSHHLEQFLTNIDYIKYVEDEIAHFQIDSEDWNHPHNPISSEVLSFLHFIIGGENYGFIRLGDAADDTEIHGDIENFNMTVERSIKKIYE